MKIKKVGKLLKKLNNLYDNIKDEGGVSAIEQDLFLSYLKEIYEYTIDGAPARVQERTELDPTPRTEEREVVHIADPAPTMPEVVEPVAVEEPVAEPATLLSDIPTGEEVITTPPAPPVEEVSSIVEVVEEAPVVSIPATPSYPEEMLELFAETEIAEVSDMLRMRPIPDLTRAMGINEKIFTVRELFGKDQVRFEETIQHLNGLQSFDEAKTYLMDGVANDFGWADPAMFKKALNFIKLVQRRYR